MINYSLANCGNDVAIVYYFMDFLNDIFNR